MKSSAPLVLIAVLIAGVAMPAALAAGTDGNVEILWWDQDFELRAKGLAVDTGADDLAFRGDFFWGRIGLTAGQYTSDVDADGFGEVEYRNLDFVWKALAPGEGAYLGVGAGWQTVEVDLDQVGLNGDTDGPRIAVLGEVGFVYGRLAWMPDLDDFVSDSLSVGDVRGREWEVGFKYDFLDKMQVLAGWRSYELDFDLRDSDGSVRAETASDGWVVGVGVHF